MSKKKNIYQEQEILQTWRNRIGLDVKAESMGINYSKFGRGFTEKPKLNDELKDYFQNRPHPEAETMDKEGKPVESYNHEMNWRRHSQYDDYNLVNVVHPLRMFRPTNLQQIREIINYALKHDYKVKAVGSGHSYSDMTTTSDFLVKTDFFNEVLNQGDDKKYIPKHFQNLKKEVKDYFKANDFNTVSELIGKDPFDGSPMTLFECEAGIKIRDLNKELHKYQLALINLGTYQGQAFMGAASTSTHGTGIYLPPIPDMIASLVLVATDEKGEKSRVYRIEPTNGISSRPGLGEDELIQDDDIFRSALVNMGCFGIVYSVILRARPIFYQVEEVSWITWKDLRAKLEKGFEFPNILPGTQDSLNTLPTNSEFFFRKERKSLDGKDVYKTVREEIEPGKFKNNIAHTAIRNMTIYVNPYLIDDNGEAVNISVKENINGFSVPTQANTKGNLYCKVIRRYMASKEEIEFIKKGMAGELRRKDFDGKKTLTEFAMSDEVSASLPLTLVKYISNQRVEYLQEGISTQNLQKQINKIPQFLNKALIFNTAHAKSLAQNIRFNNDKYRKRVGEVVKNKGVETISNDLEGNVCYRLSLAGGDRIGGYGAEVAFDFHSKKYLEAMDKLIETAQKVAHEGLHLQTTIFSIRFVAPSQAYLSPQHSENGSPTVMLELLSLNDTHGGKEMMQRYQREMFKLGGRVHWGLEFNVLNGSNETIPRMYGKGGYQQWKKCFDKFNKNGVFNNRFTDRLGFSDLFPSQK